MNYIDVNNDNKIGRKGKTLNTKFLSFFLICDLRKEKTFKGQKVLISNSKNIYMKIDIQFRENITLISNDADP